MADLADVEDALAALAGQALYPDGPEESSVLGVVCRVFRGWPNSAALNADLTAGLVNVTVAPDTEAGRTTTRFTTRWHAQPTATRLAATVTGNTVVFSGLAEPGQLAGIKLDSRAFAYKVAPGDTPDLVAASLASLIRPTRLVQVSGARLTFPDAGSVLARIAMSATGFTEIRRQERNLRIVFWCPSPSLRDTAVSTVDSVLARQAFMDMRDGTKARLIYAGTAVFDQAQNALLYRRDLVYTTEYPTILTDFLPAMLFGDLAVNAADFIA